MFGDKGSCKVCVFLKIFNETQFVIILKYFTDI